MNITIFGDSFGDDMIEGLIQTETSWMDVLRENGHTITNFSKGGSSLYYSYTKYFDYINSSDYLECNLIIFIVTGPGREELVLDDQTFFLTSIPQIEVIRDHKVNSEEQRKIMEAVRIYWAFCKDIIKDDVFHNLMIKDIKSREKMFVIETYIYGKTNCITDLSRKELQLLNPEITDVQTEMKFMKSYIDRRKCHFTSVNNKMIGNKILQAIKTKQKTVEFDTNDIVQPEYDLTYYLHKAYD